jgi:hypothetical protein
MEGFSFTPGQDFQVTPAMKKQFEKDGYIMVK